MKPAVRVVVGSAALFFAACAVGTADDGSGDPTNLPGAGTVTEAGTDSGTTPGSDSGSGADSDTTSDSGSGTGTGTDSGTARDSAPPGDAAPPNDAATNFACVGTVDFESGAAGYAHDAIDGFAGDNSWPFDVWANGAAANGLGCKSGTNCFATGLTSNYVQCGRAELKSPNIDLSTCAAAGTVKIAFQHAYAFWTGAYGGTTWYDGGIVELSGDGGSTWQAAPGLATTGTLAINPNRGSSYACLSPNAFHVNGKAGFVGASTGWQAAEIVVPAALRTSQFRIRFAYASGVSFATTDPATSRLHTAAGWHVDDVQVIATP